MHFNLLNRPPARRRPEKPVSLEEWYASPLGRHLVEHVSQRLESFLSTSFGYYALSMGCEAPACEILNNCRVKHVFRMGKGSTNVDLRMNGVALPVASDSTDLVLLMHALSQSSEPHALLREVNRVLIPDGRLVIVDFNPVSLWGIRHLLQGWLDDAPWGGHYYTAHRLKDWASLLGFEQLHHYRCGYVLPLDFERLIQRSHIFGKFSERWLAFSSAVNVLVFEKNTIPLTPIRKYWVKQQILPAKVAPPTVGRGMKYDK
jgi:SAM-dependent methyltransferase